MHPRFEVIVYAGSRLGSAVMSISVFALIARTLPPNQVESVFSLMFVIGFAVALLRSYCMLSANLVGELRGTERLRRIAVGAQRYGRLMPLALALLIVVFSFQSLPWWALPIVAAIACAAGYDSDLTRAALNRAALYPWLFFGGNAASLLLLLTLDRPDFRSVILAVLVGWIAPGLFGISRWVAERRLASRHKVQPWARSGAVSWRPLLIASLEGVVLNAPFLGGTGANMSGSRGYDLAIAIRVFSSSQPLFSLITHWSNSGRLWKFGKQLHISEVKLYALLLLTTGMIASVLFVILFAWISHQEVTGIQYGMFVVLLAGYCSYLSETRFHAMSLSSRRVWLVYVLVPVFFLITLTLLQSLNAPAWTVAILQGGSLLLAAITIHVVTQNPRSQSESP